MTKEIRAKKYLGQHFLRDINIAKKIAEILPYEEVSELVEVGPGMGVLTQFLMDKVKSFKVVEIDVESVAFLKNKWGKLAIVEGDFLRVDVDLLFGTESRGGIIGNFPYNISSQILFRTIEMRDRVQFFAGMFQKELAERICASNHSKAYGQLSVLVQAFYEVSYKFSVPPSVFSPPPKVDSGVISMTRKADYKLACDEKLFTQVVKTGFNQRRKTLRNSLKGFNLGESLKQNPLFDQRPEQLTVNQFVELTNLIAYGAANK